MLYEGAIRFLKIAVDNMEPRSYDVVNNNITKAQDIITELMLSLNMEQGGQISENLFNLYAYMKKRLLEGNMNKDAATLEEVAGLLEELRSTWDEAAKKNTGKKAPTSSGDLSFSITG